MRYLLLILLLITLRFSGCSQNAMDTLPYTLYKHRLILYTDLGFNAAPFTLQDDFSEGIDKIRFKHNLKATMGFGVMYRWFSLRIGFGLPGNLRPTSRFGESRYTDIGVTFNLKNVYWDIDLRNYEQYVIVDAKEWNDTLNDLIPNDLRPRTRAVSFSTNAWYFPTKDFKMAAVFGKVGHVNREIKTWYAKTSFNIFGIGNQEMPILPTELIDTLQTQQYAHSISALDLGIIPGYAYVNRIENWQIGAFGGLGGVIQAKFYGTNTVNRGFLGLAPRLDLRFIGGYSKENFFAWFVTDFDIKSIRFKELRYNQTFYSLKLVTGIRFEGKKKAISAGTELR